VNNRHWATKGLVALLSSLLLVAVLRVDAATLVELPVAVTKGRHALDVSRAGKVGLYLNELRLVSLLLTLTDSGGFVDQRPHYVSITATAEDADVFRLSAVGTLTTKAGSVFDFAEGVAFDADGATVSYELTPRTDCTIEVLRLSLNFSVADFGGRHITVVDNKGGVHTWGLPAEKGEAILGSAAAVGAAAEFGDDNAVEISQIEGAYSTYLWDMRAWNQTQYSLNLRFAAGELKAGTPCRLSLRLGTRHKLRDPVLLAKVEQIREARKAHFLEHLRAKFKGKVLPLAPFDFAHADWQALRASGQGLEQIIPYVAQVCETIDMDPESKLFGYLDFHWRSGIAPDNATYVECMQPLACVWSTPGDWNPYYHDKALMQRIEAMAIYYCELVGLNGGFGGPWSHPLARIAEAYYRVGEAVDPDIAGVWVDRMLRRAEWIGREMVVDGQCTNQQAEGFHALQWTYWATGDERVLEWIDELKQRYLREAIQPPGYPVEMQGPDYYYQNVSTMALFWYYDLSRDPDILAAVRDRIIPWYGYVTLAEPPAGDDAGMLIGIRGHDTRTRGYARSRIPWVDSWTRYNVESAKAFHAATTAQAQPQAEEPSAEPMPQLPLEKLVEDRVWRNYVGTLPDSILERIGGFPDDVALSAKEVLAARRQVLACFREPFSRQLSDDYGGEYLFMRRPGYYAAISWGPIVQPAQRKGAGLQALWFPEVGTVVLSQNRQGPSHELVLTIPGTDERYYSAHAVPRVEVASQDGICSKVACSWELKGIPCKRRYVFDANRVEVRITHGALSEEARGERWHFEEVIPLMMDSRSQLAVLNGPNERSITESQAGLTATGILLRKNKREVKVQFRRKVVLDINPVAYKDANLYANAAGIAVARVAVRMPPEGTLVYRIAVKP